MLSGAGRRLLVLRGALKYANPILRSAAPTSATLRQLSVSASFAQTQSQIKTASTAAQDDDHKAKQSRKRPIDPCTGQPRIGGNWSYKAELHAFAHRLGFDSEQLPSLKKALIEKSSVRVSSPRVAADGSERRYIDHNGRLSVLGRAVVGHYVLEYLYFTYPNLEGGMIEDLCSFLTCEQTLVELANHLGVTELIRTRHVLNEAQNNYIINDSFCATVAAAYNDIGPKAARKIVHDFVVTQLAGKDLNELIKLEHPRFMLQTLLKSRGQPRLVPRLIRESGRLTHFPSFVVGVFSGGELLGEGCGTSLKRAEREALNAALRKHFQTELLNAPLPSDHEDFCSEGNLNTLHEIETVERGPASSL